MEARKSRQRLPEGVERKKTGRKKLDSGKILEEALKAVQENMLFSIYDINPFISCHIRTVLEYHPAGSEGHTKLMEACDNNKIKVKKTQEKKMYNSDNPACIAMLYRIVATPEERNAINQGYIETAKDGKATPITSITIVRGES